MMKNSKSTIALLSTAAATAAVAVPATATSLAGDAGRAAAARPAVSDLDVDLVGGRTLEVTVEARRAATVKLAYAGVTRTARRDPDDADDRDKDYLARFQTREADRAAGRQVSIKVTATATGAGGATT